MKIATQNCPEIPFKKIPRKHVQVGIYKTEGFWHTVLAEQLIYLFLLVFALWRVVEKNSGKL